MTMSSSKSVFAWFLVFICIKINEVQKSIAVNSCKKTSTYFPGAPSKEVKEVQLLQKKLLPTALGAPSSEVKEVQFEQLKSPPTFCGAPSSEVKEVQPEQ